MDAINVHYFLSGLEKYLLEQSGVTNVSVKYGPPVNHAHLISWERNNHVTLPDDVRQFYKTHNGVSLSWQHTCNGDNPVGKISIEALNELIVISCSSLSILSDHDNWEPLSPNSSLVIFAHCTATGYSCLSFNDTGLFKGVWLIDLSLTCHLLSSSFTDYLRLVQVHLGLIQWPYALTKHGLSSDYEVWFEIFAPLRLSMDSSPSSSSSHKQSPHVKRPNFEQLAHGRKGHKNRI